MILVILNNSYGNISPHLLKKKNQSICHTTISLSLSLNFQLSKIQLSASRSRHFLPRRAFPTRRSLGTRCTRPRSPSAWTVSYWPSHVDPVSSLHTNREGRWETLVSASPSGASHSPVDRKPWWGFPCTGPAPSWPALGRPRTFDSCPPSRFSIPILSPPPTPLPPTPFLKIRAIKINYRPIEVFKIDSRGESVISKESHFTLNYEYLILT